MDKYSDWVERLHTIAEEFHKQDARNGFVVKLLRKLGYCRKRPEDQCALRWSANVVAERRNAEIER